MKRDPKRIEKVFTAIEIGDVAEASRLSRDSRDPVLRMMWNGLESPARLAPGSAAGRCRHRDQTCRALPRRHGYAGHSGAVARFVGHDHRSDESFSFLGNEELAVQAVTGGIAEALIATACGLGIAIFALIPFNFFTSRVSNLEFELQTAATNLEVMLEAQSKSDSEGVEIPATTPSSATRSSI